MKLRNKLAAVLAATMVVTSIPVVTMATSTNDMTISKLIAAENTEYTQAATAPALRIKLDSRTFNDLKNTYDQTGNYDVFYVKLENASWAKDLANTYLMNQYSQDGKVEFVVQDDKTLKVMIKDATAYTNTADNNALIVDHSNNTLYIPVLSKIGKGEVKVSIEANGSVVNEGSWIVATTSKKIATAQIDENIPSFEKQGLIAPITIKEAYKGSMKQTGSTVVNGVTVNHQNYALFEIENSEFKFTANNDFTFVEDDYYIATKDSDSEVTGFVRDTTRTGGTKYAKYALKANLGHGFGYGTVTLDAYLSSDETSLYVELPNGRTTDSQGTIKIESLEVKSTTKAPATGDLKVSISGHVEDINDVVVAKIGEYGIDISVKEDKVVDIVAGQEKEVEFTIKETINDTLTHNREIEVKLENGYLAEVLLDAEGSVDEKATLKAIQNTTGTGVKIDLLAKLEHKDTKGTVRAYTANEIKNAITDIEVEEGKVVGFTFKPQDRYTSGRANSFEMKANIRIGLNQSGDVTVGVNSRDLEKEVSKVIVNAKKAVEVTSEAAVLKTGLKDQITGKLTITESDKAILKRGEDLIVFFPNTSGIQLSAEKDEKPEVKVTSGDLQVGTVTVTTAINAEGKKVPALKVAIKRDSKTASTIEITNFHFDTDRTAAEGKYDVTIAGKALTPFEVEYKAGTADAYKAPAETIKVENFLVNGTPNTQDISTSNGLAKGTVTFEIGKNTYTGIDGTEKTMDAKAYIQDPGYTMVPVRYVAEAFGVSEKDILFSSGVVTIFAGTRTIQLTSGSEIAMVNGAKVAMGTKVTIKNGRTYAPIGEIARILGISTKWDGTNKVATFTNN